MIELGFKQGYERSADVGGIKFDGTVERVVSRGRTSTNAWCSGGNLKYILCINTDLCYTQMYNGRKKRLVICVGRPAVMPKLIPQTCTDLCFAQICRIQNRI
jgi:hypothetical protein